MNSAESTADAVGCAVSLSMIAAVCGDAMAVAVMLAVDAAAAAACCRVESCAEFAAMKCSNRWRHSADADDSVTSDRVGGDATARRASSSAGSADAAGIERLCPAARIAVTGCDVDKEGVEVWAVVVEELAEAAVRTDCPKTGSGGYHYCYYYYDYD